MSAAGFVRGPELLAVPRPDRIRPEQAAGHRCVWCPGPPTVSLGTRLSTSSGPERLRRWHPRACEPCTRTQAARVLDVHLGSCRRCAPAGGFYCADARALSALAAGEPIPAP
ncbi:hypothetical protein [Streptomyces sp. NPDC057115]|uniref:hypothetical protein n=1 Tax=Streptomyces sp. NPDC057115 TaxID=3346022 RepID=UPI0036339EE5